jgi:hypothetical protein
MPKSFYGSIAPNLLDIEPIFLAFFKIYSLVHHDSNEPSPI